jgi:hypothetical protein
MSHTRSRSRRRTYHDILDYATLAVLAPLTVGVDGWLAWRVLRWLARTVAPTLMR